VHTLTAAFVGLVLFAKLQEPLPLSLSSADHVNASHSGLPARQASPSSPSCAVLQRPSSAEPLTACAPCGLRRRFLLPAPLIHGRRPLPWLSFGFTSL